MGENTKKSIFHPTITEELYDDNNHLGIESIVFLYRLAINSLWEELGFPLKTLQEREGLTRMTLESHIQYLGEVTTGKDIRIESSFARIGNSSYDLSQGIYDGNDALLGTHYQTALFLDNDSKMSRYIPSHIRGVMIKYLSLDEQDQKNGLVSSRRK